MTQLRALLDMQKISQREIIKSIAADYLVKVINADVNWLRWQLDLIYPNPLVIVEIITSLMELIGNY